jgi:hypothetical protein
MISSDLVESLKAKKLSVQRVAASEDGKVLFEMLRKEFDDSQLFDPDPLKTAYRLGARDLYVYLKEVSSTTKGDL